jgi:hypothetical protein
LGVLVGIYRLESLLEHIWELQGEGYNGFGIYLAGSRRHEAKGLLPNMALVHAWKRRPAGR